MCRQRCANLSRSSRSDGVFWDSRSDRLRIWSEYKIKKHSAPYATFPTSTKVTAHGDRKKKTMRIGGDWTSKKKVAVLREGAERQFLSKKHPQRSPSATGVRRGVWS